jgi:hypothetical protein
VSVHVNIFGAQEASGFCLRALPPFIVRAEWANDMSIVAVSTANAALAPPDLNGTLVYERKAFFRIAQNSAVQK